MSNDRLCHDIENKNGVVPPQPDAPRCLPVSPRGEDRRRQAIARYLAGERIEEICRELGCSKSWLYKWRDRYQADDSTWAQEQTRRPRSNSRQTPDTIVEAIIHLCQAWESQGAGRTSVATIWQALKEQGMDPLPLAAHDLSDRPTPQQRGKPRYATSSIASLIWGMCTRSCFGTVSG